jgi:hypothetical protein
MILVSACFALMGLWNAFRFHQTGKAFSGLPAGSGRKVTRRDDPTNFKLAIAIQLGASALIMSLTAFLVTGAYSLRYLHSLLVLLQIRN